MELSCGRRYFDNKVIRILVNNAMTAGTIQHGFLNGSIRN